MTVEKKKRKVWSGAPTDPMMCDVMIKRSFFMVTESDHLEECNHTTTTTILYSHI